MLSFRAPELRLPHDRRARGAEGLGAIQADAYEYQGIDADEDRCRIEKMEMRPAQDDIDQEQRETAPEADAQRRRGAVRRGASPKQPHDEYRNDRWHRIREHGLQVMSKGREQV